VAISALTHVAVEAGEACVLWYLAIRHAALTGELDARVELARLDPARGAVQALQVARWGIARTRVPDDDPAYGTFCVQHRLAGSAAAWVSGAAQPTVGGRPASESWPIPATRPPPSEPGL